MTVYIVQMRAAKAGNHTAVEQLLVRDHADPNTREVDYVSCSFYKCIFYVSSLLQLRWTPLMWAGYKGHTETVKVLLKNKADPNKTANVRATNIMQLTYSLLYILCVRMGTQLLSWPVVEVITRSWQLCWIPQILFLLTPMSGTVQ